MRPADFARALAEIRAATGRRFGVNIPLGNPRAPTLLDIGYEARLQAMVASRGGSRGQRERFRAIGTKWLHVVVSVERATNAEAAGVDGLIVDGAEAGVHPACKQSGLVHEIPSAAEVMRRLVADLEDAR
ncbi:MAG: hypothetical protein RML56_00950 [Burkholderiales bacterium]|nr:hypothetical protein [Burkholderiales bacterium]